MLILTSTFPRHRFVARELASRLSAVGLWQEEKSFVPERHAQAGADLDLVRTHFAARDRAEARDFGDDLVAAAVAGPCRRVGPGGLNDPAEVERMTATRPDVVTVFGTGILKDEILSVFDGRLLNIHLGLSPYYRGSGTNFWPLVNGEPEFVGATIHYLDAGIDTGPIIAHVRPEIVRDDGPHDIGNKAIRAGASMMVRAVGAHATGRVRSRPQTSRGRLYQRKDFNSAAVRRLYEQFAGGMIGRYLDDRASRDARLDLVTLDNA